MSLSPLNPSSASDLHVNNARDLPLDFRPTSINSGLDHILSGFNTCVKPLIHMLRVTVKTAITFISHYQLNWLLFTLTLNSLVRVTRRDENTRLKIYVLSTLTMVPLGLTSTTRISRPPNLALGTRDHGYWRKGFIQQFPLTVSLHAGTDSVACLSPVELVL